MTDLRALASHLLHAHGALAGDAAHHLATLADLLDGVPADLAGVHCVGCGASLAEGAHEVEAGEGVVALCCIACIAEGRA